MQGQMKGPWQQGKMLVWLGKLYIHVESPASSSLVEQTISQSFNAYSDTGIIFKEDMKQQHHCDLILKMWTV